MRDTSAGHRHEPGRYEIRIQGHLAARWAAWFDGMTLTTHRDGTTVLEGPVVDQAALHGLLHQLRDLGLPWSRSPSSTPTRRHPSTHPGHACTPHTKETDMATTTTPATTARRAPVDWTRKYAFATGLFYLITFAASIPAAFYFLTPVLNDPNYIVSSGADTRVVIGCLLDTVNALAGIATAVAFYPVARRLNESLAIGFVTTRMFEAAVIMVGVVSLLAVVTLRQDAGGTTGADQASLLTTGQALVADP